MENKKKDENREIPLVNKSSSLSFKQLVFPYMVAKLILFAYDNGYKVTLGEAHRTKEQAEIYAKQGRGIKNSLHRIRIAIDLNLYKNDRFLDQSDDHIELGEYWEKLGGSWGGRFGDGNHYSIEHEGRK
ncbi:MAG: M15 family metallopeptidase [Cyclonatronaceae bacterium]